MTAPLADYGNYSLETTLIIAFALGIGFGFALERAGFGSARKLAAQFYFKDMAVLKVMFTAIVTAMIGVFYLGWMGILDLSLVYLTPTYLMPQVVGGLLLGVGFVVGGYCPGTSVVASASGKLDAMVYVAGVIFGVFAYAESYPWVKGFAASTPMGEVTLPAQFNLGYGLLVFAVIVMAIGAFSLAQWGEKKVGKEVTP